MNNINNIIKEELDKFLIKEVISDVVYHFTTLSTLKKIISTDTFYLPTWLKGKADKYDEKRKFYLSVTRQRNKDMGYSRSKNVRIELNGEKLNYNFKGKAINYWGSSMGKDSYYSNTKSHGTNGIIPYIQSNTENEDRIFSYSPKIENFNKYIKRIDILIENEKEYAYAKSILQMRYYDFIYVYDNKKDFNYQTDNIINNDILSNEYKQDIAKKWGVYEPICVGDVVNFILNGMGLRYENIDDKKLGEIIAKLLKRYNLNNYISYVINYCKQEFYHFNFTYNNLERDIENMHQNMDNMETYNNVMNMLIDFLNEYGFKDLNDVRKNFLKKWKKKKGTYYNDNDFDYDKKINFLVYLPSYKYTQYIIPEPNKESFWDLFPNTKEYILSDEFFNNVRSYKSKNEVSFRKYIQHLTHINISVNDMLNIINKLDVEDFIRYNLINGELINKEISYLQVDRYGFFSEKDKIIVNNMFLNEKYK